MLALLAWAAATPAFTWAQAPPAEQRIALVIGNAAYKEAPLRNPVNDARAMAARLKALGFAVTTVENGTLAEMGRAVVEFGRRLGPSAAALVFYAGHGIQSHGRNYLIPVDASLNAEGDLRYQALDVTGLIEEIEQSQSRVGFVILDACRNNPFERRMRGMSPNAGLAAIDAARGLMIAYATAPGSVAADGAGANGVYTAALLKALAEPGLKAEEVFKRVRIAVTSETQNLQTPWESSSLTGDFVFNPSPAAAGPNAAATPQAAPGAAEIVFWQSIQGSTSRADFEAYLAQFPQGTFAPLARNRIAALAGPPAAPPAPAPGQHAVLPRDPGAAFRDCPDCPQMVAVPGGRFMMGSPPEEDGRDDDEGPQHTVTVGGFALGRFEVTRGEFAVFARETGFVPGGGCNGYTGSEWKNDPNRTWREPGFPQTERDPVVCVNWHDAKAYVDWLARKTGKPYRLPTEAEWEYAARAGVSAARPWGAAADQACAFANVADRTARQRYPGWTVHGCDDGHVFTAPVGGRKANGLGLHDMLGNVWEWVEDCYARSYAGAPADGAARLDGDCGKRVLRGGSWYSIPASVRSANRYTTPLTLRYDLTGFRVARGG